MKTNKIKPSTKAKITKAFKKDLSVPEIRDAVIEECPKITLERIRTIIRKHLKDLCDKLWSDAVKIRDGGKCVISGKRDNLNSHHLIGRSNYRFRWDIMNGVTLSPDHHTLGRKISAHGSTDVTDRFAEWMKKYKPKRWAWFQKHRDDKQQIKVDIYMLLETSRRLTEETEELQSKPKVDILVRKKVPDA